MSERDARIELARIFSMLLVVIMHINTQGGLANALQPMSPNYLIEWILLSITYCAVDLFAIISGYVGFESRRFRYSRILNLWLGTVFYTVIITVCFAIFVPNSVKPIDFVKAITPASTGSYWFFSSYFAMFFFIPFMNYMLNTLDDKQMKQLGITIIIVFSIIPTMKHSDPWETNKGYSTIWLMCLYMIGGIIRRFKLLEKRKHGFYIKLFFSCLALLWISKILLEAISIRLTGEIRGGGFLYSYLSPVVILMAVAILGFCISLKAPGIRMSKVICSISATTFSVFIIHEQPLIKHHYISGRFAQYAEQNVVMMIINVLLAAVSIFGTCTLIDLVRRWLFFVLHVKERAEKLCSMVAKRVRIIS